jgi:hypothetical protein
MKHLSSQKCWSNDLCYIPITPKLKRLFLREEMTQQMRWHKEWICDSEDADIMSHPANADAWHALDHSDIMSHPANAEVYRLMVSNLIAPIVLPYNLPPKKYLKEGFIFLSHVIPGPKEPKKQMNIFLHSLMEELKELWQGVDAYDRHLKCRFNLRATYLWSIHDYLAYGKFVG